MRNLKTRSWSTPATIGAGIFVMAAGLLMFFVSERPFKGAHELVGMVFVGAAVFHILSNWRPFRKLLLAAHRPRCPRAAPVDGNRSCRGVGLPGPRGAGRGSSSRRARTPRSTSWCRSSGCRPPMVRFDVGELVDRLAADGLMVEDPGLSVERVALESGADPDDMLFSVFR